jgi:hypothetical protein
LEYPLPPPCGGGLLRPSPRPVGETLSKNLMISFAFIVGPVCQLSACHGIREEIELLGNKGEMSGTW